MRFIVLLFICSFIYPCYVSSIGFRRISKVSLKKTKCEDGYFQCNSGECIPVDKKCDYIDHCIDGSDEDFECDHLDEKSFITCAKDQFKCKNQECIPAAKYCDMVNDCLDESDEHDGCVKHLNCTNKFLCTDGHCINKEWVCDGRNDCPDGNDEWNCKANKTSSASSCKTENYQYMCANHRCISLKVVCDKKDDCGDGSDEGPGCTQFNCSSAGCQSNCHQTPKGSVCTCKPGYKLQKDNRTCNDIDECQAYGICDQDCMNVPGSYACTCQREYYLENDKRTCKARAGEATLVFSTRTSILGMHVDSEKFFSLATNLNHAVGVAMYGDYVYWSNLEENGYNTIVKKRTYHPQAPNEVIVTTGLALITGIDVDWITKNIYFADEDNHCIGVCTNDGTYCTVLIKDTDKPTGVALLPTQGKMYWSDWGTFPHIAVAGMDGKNVRIFVNVKLEWPKSVTIDYPNERLYWVDAKSKMIESVRLDGTDRRIVLHDIIQEPFSMTVFQNKLYWSDWESNGIQTCNKFTGKDWKILIRNHNKPYSVHMDHSAIKPNIDNPCYSNPCSQLCMLNQNKGYTCGCTLDKKLNADKHTCQDVKKNQHLLIIQGRKFINYYHEFLGKPKVMTLSLQHMSQQSYNNLVNIISDPLSGQIIICHLQLSTPFLTSTTDILRYDPVHHSSEKIVTINKIFFELAFDYIGNNLYTTNTVNQSIEVINLNTKAMTAFYFKDEVPKYIALAPEESKMFVAFQKSMHSISGLTLYEMQMNGLGKRKLIREGLIGPQLPMYYDRDSKTLFVSDLLPGYIYSHSAQDTRILRSGLKSPHSLTVAGDNLFWIESQNKLYSTNFRTASVKQKTVEFDLSKLNDNMTSLPGHLTPYSRDAQYVVTLRKDDIPKHDCQKNNGNCSHVCLPSLITSFICACPPGMELSNDNRTCISHHECSKNEYKCSEHNICIQRNQLCDGIENCPNGEDETSECRIKGRCKENQFMCKNGDCIRLKDRCNSRYDCTDQSDEQNCEKPKCKSDEFQCKFTETCIPKTKMCDSNPDCDDLSDEEDCRKVECTSNEFKCNNGKCIPNTFVCDNDNDCEDGEDEAAEKCYSKIACKMPKMFKCPNGDCISDSLLCNGINDCNDGSDEVHCLSNVTTHLVNCSLNEYRCLGTDICLPKNVRCDGKNDCPQSDDEQNCTYCFENEFACDNKRCIPELWVCDKANDCGDNSDEKNCDGSKRNFIESNECDEFKCSVGTCLPYSKVCDGNRDCPDGSDETGKCQTACTVNNFCKGMCYKTPAGAVCGCQSGYRLAVDMISCEDINECELDICSQMCRNTIGSYECFCKDEFIIRNDKTSCKAVGPAMEFITVTDNDIRKMTHNLHSTTQLLFPLMGVRVSGLDVNAVSDSVYWSNDEFGTIKKLNIRTNEIVTVKIVEHPQALAVDWITGNVYVNDNSHLNTIKVCNLEKGKCATLVKIQDKMKVASVIVDSINRWLFWAEISLEADHPTSKICRTDMTGADMKIIASDLGFVRGMTIDHVKSKLYWSDDFYKTVESSNFDGSQRKVVLTLNMNHALSISIFEQSLYFLSSDNLLSSCKMYGKRSCEHVNIGANNVFRLFSILHISRQVPFANPCDAEYCDYMCVLKKENATCICSDGESIESNSTCNIKNDLKFVESINFSRNTRNISGIYSITIIVLLVSVLLLCVYYYYQKNKLKSKPASNLSCSSIHFQNPSYDRSDEIEVMLDSMASSELSPGQHEYINPINNKGMKAAENNAKKSNQCSEGKNIEEEKQDALIYFVHNSK
ncbi:vitellogenin receptor precursor [Solenopsis invicta]|uniref:Vitellogenin receptor n=1 Tax=Solenopsis invicta TaxID=13686 RepID=VGR_SOLIN|nr:vitellogenin receptor precursor [Solenopsis invicta]Q6X0I2.1 RecName: Full=Vitellogenin receptor; Short=SiVgR; Flags: Precursor [Solenopsis invicta]AAP92450.1 vitellogenin receptor [Solenopsis invicta]